jgi:hypothetical protein
MPDSRPPSLTIQAERISAVAQAASLALSGGSLPPQATEALVIDLMDVVALLVARLASDAEIVEARLQGARA